VFTTEYPNVWEPFSACMTKWQYCEEFSVFRFSLRHKDSDSLISDKSFTAQEVKDLLRDFSEEAELYLMNLRTICKMKILKKENNLILPIQQIEIKRTNGPLFSSMFSKSSKLFSVEIWKRGEKSSQWISLESERKAAIKLSAELWSVRGRKDLLFLAFSIAERSSFSCSCSWPISIGFLENLD
jgi:hypothetical protein